MTRAKNKTTNRMGWRLWGVKILVAGFVILLLGRLYTLQVSGHDHYSALAAGRQNVSSILTPERGRILVQDNALASGTMFSEPGQTHYPVAVNRKAEHLAISPYDIEEDSRVATVLSEITGVDITQITDVLKQKERRYWILKKDLSEAEIETVAQAKKEGRLPKLGIWLESEVRRHYPEGQLLSHVLGFIPVADQQKGGLYGLELSFNETLSGEAGKIEARADARGSIIFGPDRKLNPATNGSDLVLTIDRAIQVETEKVLKDQVQKFGADSGTVLVVNPKTGAILAMASEPSFNPNEYNKVDNVNVFVNPAVQARYEPGSVVKPLTMAAALDTGKLRFGDTYVDSGSEFIDGYTIRNSDLKAHDTQTMTQVLEKSLNTGMIHIQRTIGKEAIKDYFYKFGLSERTGVELPGEIVGDLRNLDTSSDVAYATASFGQGISMTPLQLIQAYTALANGGRMMQLHLLSEIRHPDGSVDVIQPQKVRNVVSTKVAAEISEMLVSVVENGHGKKAKVPGYYIAGKTGTAQVPLQNARGYDPQKTIGSFVGYGPVENPAFLMMVKIDNPRGVRFAESTAAPVFGQIGKFILDYMQVPPTRTVE